MCNHNAISFESKNVNFSQKNNKKFDKLSFLPIRLEVMIDEIQYVLHHHTIGYVEQFSQYLIMIFDCCKQSLTRL